MNSELLEALEILEKERDISKETMFEAIETSLVTACRNHFGKADNIKAEINRETGEYRVYAEKEVVKEDEDPVLQTSALLQMQRMLLLRRFVKKSVLLYLRSLMIKKNLLLQVLYRDLLVRTLALTLERLRHSLLNQSRLNQNILRLMTELRFMY